MCMHQVCCRGFIQRNGYDTSYNALARCAGAHCVPACSGCLACFSLSVESFLTPCLCRAQACGKEQQRLEPDCEEGQHSEEGVPVW